MNEKNTNTVIFTMRLPMKIVKKGKYYVSSCPVLDVHSQGLSQRQAEKNLKEAISLFLLSCLERGTLDAVLKECGFVAVPEAAMQPLKKQPREGYINVPIPLLWNKTRKTPCRA